MKDESISQFPVATLESLPEDIRRKVLNIQEKIGFVPNVFLAMGHRPKELSAFLAYHDAVLSHESTLTKSEMEMIIVATSSKNDCPYCVIAHGAILRIHTKIKSFGKNL